MPRFTFMTREVVEARNLEEAKEQLYRPETLADLKWVLIAEGPSGLAYRGRPSDDD